MISVLAFIVLCPLGLTILCLKLLIVVLQLFDTHMYSKYWVVGKEIWSCKCAHMVGNEMLYWLNNRH